MKIFVLLVTLILSNCSTPEKIVKYNPTIENGCSAITESKERLVCISKMVKQLEDIRNSKIIIVDKKKVSRIDETYSSFKTTYCFTDQTEKDKFLCFESIKEEYDPTFIGIVFDYSKKIGFGFVVGLVTGLSYSN